MNIMATTPAINQPVALETKQQSYTMAMAVVTMLFFMWGFLTCLNDILVPHFKIIFDLNYTQVMLIQFTFFAAYFIMSIPSGKIVARIGYKKGIVVGLVTAGIGALLFYPAAGIPSYPLFLTALFRPGRGNHHAAGDRKPVRCRARTAADRLQPAEPHAGFQFPGTHARPGVWRDLHPCRCLPHAGTGPPSSERPADHVSTAGSGICAGAVSLPGGNPVCPGSGDGAVQAAGDRDGGRSSRKSARLRDALKHKHLVLGAIGIFLYVGAEVSIGSFLVNFFGEKDIAGMTPQDGAKYVSFYWGAAMVGRFIGSALLQKLDPRKMLGVVASIASLLVVVTILSTGHVAMWTIISVGLVQLGDVPDHLYARR